MVSLLKELKGRVLTAFILIPLFLGILYLGKYAFAALIIVFITGAFLEFATLYDLGIRIKITGMIWLITLIILTVFERTSLVILLPLAYFFLIPFFWNKGDSIKKLSLGIFILVYLSFGAVTVYFIRTFFGFYHALSFFLIIWTFDSAAYLSGSLWGKRRLAVKISPRKSVEGYLLGILFTVPIVIAMKYIGIYRLPLVKAILGGVFISILSQVGDLVESAMKREVGVKDSSTIFPGHGGFLDRVDSIVFTAPFYFIFLLRVI